jgi:hypothetical protein
VSWALPGAAGELLQRQPRHGLQGAVRQRWVGQNGGETGVRGHEAQTLLRVRRVQRDEGGARTQDAQQAREHLERMLDVQADTRA